MRVQRLGNSAVVQSSETAEGWIEHPLGRFLLGSPQSSLSLARTTREHSSLEVVRSNQLHLFTPLARRLNTLRESGRRCSWLFNGHVQCRVPRDVTNLNFNQHPEP